MDVIEARAAHQQAELAWHDAQRAAQLAERMQTRAQQAFSSARSVLDLRAAEAQLAATRSACSRAAARVTACEQACRSLAAGLQAHERTLLEAELGRRAVERKLAQRATHVGRRAEREQEAEAEDAYRVTNSR